MRRSVRIKITNNVLLTIIQRDLNLFICMYVCAKPFRNGLEMTQGKFLSSVKLVCGGARGVMVIVVGNGHGDASSNP